jgi:hypothetical protein
VVKRDERVVYGAQCTWWGSILDTDTVDAKVFKLPVCPNCHKTLMEVANEKEWWKQVETYIQTQPGIQPQTYRDFVLWLRKRCFPTMELAISVYELELLDATLESDGNRRISKPLEDRSLANRPTLVGDFTRRREARARADANQSSSESGGDRTG